MDDARPNAVAQNVDGGSYPVPEKETDRFRVIRAFGYSSDERYGQMARGVVIFIPFI